MWLSVYVAAHPAFGRGTLIPFCLSETSLNLPDLPDLPDLSIAYIAMMLLTRKSLASFFARFFGRLYTALASVNSCFYFRLQFSNLSRNTRSYASPLTHDTTTYKYKVQNQTFTATKFFLSHLRSCLLLQLQIILTLLQSLHLSRLLQQLRMTFHPRLIRRPYLTLALPVILSISRLPLRGKRQSRLQRSK